MRVTVRSGIFFDLKAYLIMTCMMSGGIGFYSGLGCALALAGVVFTRNYFCYKQLIVKEQEA